MNNLKFALILTFSILGSSLITILIIYLLLSLRRRRQKRKERKREEFKEKIDVKRGSDDSAMPSLSEFPLPVNRKNWNETGAGGERGRPSSEVVPTWRVNSSQGRKSAEFPFPGAGNSRKTWSASADRTAVDGGEAMNGRARRMAEGETQRARPPGSLRTLTYDADFPDQPPRFGSWLGDLRKNEDLLEIKVTRNSSTSRRRDKDGGSEIGTAF
ncbi:uncharacterized protein K444DRAFT_609278 [Hyaloscypha bicolor E]|uniref:Uncharacterized protein n=1 Tax=Hyaloscypha bicolor E TaxID=1095630 RepID=A0A2J6TM93_9HELO|nr:uncharacterized protein K444DRAFT_609278 [Hyaloscypha bicolor E]PMD64153.1 hypothetical protein K444DRAFT_609278 [Hyaloscypha bicolor E]